MSIILSSGQQKALDGIIQFLSDPNQHEFVIEGYAGTGKSTLLRELLSQWGNISEALKLINPYHVDMPMIFTATTHKAADNLFAITHQHAHTIHSVLGLKVRDDYKTGKSVLEPKQNHRYPRDSIIFVDEASQLSIEMLNYVRDRTINCKIIYMGDPAQLLAFGYNSSPVFKRGYPTVRLTEVLRNGGQILDVATKFRETVETGEFFSFKPDQSSVIWLPRGEFDAAVLEEFSHSAWKNTDSKYLSWTNKSAIRYNGAIREKVHGNAEYQVGDFMSVNSYVRHSSGDHSLKTDAMVVIEEIFTTQAHGVKGNWVTIEGHKYFCPHDPKDIDRSMRAAAKEGNYSGLNAMQSWIDLRSMYAQTVNKSQGSTYKSVFLDLDDIARASTGNLLARLMYVGVSRASEKVVMTGDLA